MDDQELDNMMNEYKKELQGEYEALLSKIQSGKAQADDYIEIVGYLQMLDKHANQKEIDSYLETGASMAQRKISSSDMNERINAFITLAEYNKFKKNYKEALKCYDMAIDAGGKEFLILRAQLKVKYLNDKNGAVKDYNIAVQSGLTEEDLKMFEILVLNEKTIWEKIANYIMIVVIVAGVIIGLALL